MEIEEESKEKKEEFSEEKDLEKVKEKMKEKMEKMLEQNKDYKERIRVAEEFAKELIKKFKKSVKSVVIYGSTARGAFNEKSDIDVFIIMDDTELEKEPSPALKDSIWNDILSIASKTDKRITVQSYMFLTEFWDNLRMVEPVLLSILRDGIVVYDTGVFMPAKRMLERGMISITREAIDKKVSSAPEFVKFAYGKLKSPAHYIEQAMAYAGNAALMSYGEYPTNKERVPELLERTFVERGLLEKKYVKYAEDIHKFAKKVEHMNDKEVADLAGELGKHVKMADEFVERMLKLIRELNEGDVGEKLMDMYKTLLKANVSALKALNIVPPEKLEDLPKVMNEQFPKLKIIHNELFDRLSELIINIKEGKEKPPSEEEINKIKEKLDEYLHRLMEELKDLKKKGKIKG